MSNTYVEAVAALRARIATLPILRGGVLTYEPQTIQQAPCAYLLYDSSQLGMTTGRISTRAHLVIARIVIARQHAETCEATLTGLVDTLPTLIEGDPLAGGTITRGWLRVMDMKSGYLDFGVNMPYRILDATVQITLKPAAATPI